MTAIEPYLNLLLSESRAERDRLRAINAELLAALKIQMQFIDGQIKARVLPEGLDFPSARAAIAKAEQVTP